MERLSPADQQARLDAALRAMSKHRAQYDALFAGWAGVPWIAHLERVHAMLAAGLPAAWDQPNPWAADGVDPSSKQYLERILAVFNGEAAAAAAHGDPTAEVRAECERIAGSLGGAAAVKFLPGPTKKPTRALEKRLSQGGRFDRIRDYGRATFVVRRGQAEVIMPALLPLLKAAGSFAVVRTKNRFARGYDPKASAGYRDYQIVVRTKRGGWLFELQILPEEMHELKNELGHGEYTQYRFAIEAANRARLASA